MAVLHFFLVNILFSLNIDVCLTLKTAFLISNHVILSPFGWGKRLGGEVTRWESCNGRPKGDKSYLKN